MNFQEISSCKFFKKITSSVLSQFKASSLQLQAFFSEDREFKHLKKISLIDGYVAISQKAGDSYLYTAYQEVEYNLKFQKITERDPNLPHEQNLLGFRLFNKNLQIVTIYIQFPQLTQIWVKWLGRTLTEVGFHNTYRLIQKIGKGSSASVYQVERICDGQLFAAKAFLKSYLDSKEQRWKSLVNEVTLLRAMDHKNILKIYGVLQSETTVYVVVERLRGGNLMQRLNQRKGLSLEESRDVMRGIVEGLAYMHKYDLMHRDLKLENIMFREVESMEPLIVDFGLAVCSEQEPYILYRCGTPGYIAPEIIQMKQNRRINVGCDIFSAGVIFHVLLTNHYLFEGANQDQIYKNNYKTRPDFRQAQYNQLNPKALNLLSKMLHLKVSQRIKAEQILEHEFLYEQGWDQINEKEDVSPSTAVDQEQYTI